MRNLFLLIITTLILSAIGCDSIVETEINSPDLENVKKKCTNYHIDLLPNEDAEHENPCNSPNGYCWMAISTGDFEPIGHISPSKATWLIPCALDVVDKEEILIEVYKHDAHLFANSLLYNIPNSLKVTGKLKQQIREATRLQRAEFEIVKGSYKIDLRTSDEYGIIKFPISIN